MTNIEILCFTFNSESIIDKILDNFEEHFGNLKITIIDNNSKDETRKLISSRKQRNWKLLVEHRQGLNFSRSTGFINSEADLLILCDDDNLLAANYIQSVAMLFNKYPNLGAVGPGIVLPVDEDFRPLDELYRTFFQYKDYKEELLLGGPNYGWKNMPAGTGLCVRRHIALSYAEKIESGTYKSTDRIGNSLSSGGDTQLVMEALRLGFDVGISGNLALKHLTIKRKLNRKYIQRMYFGIYSCASAHVEAWPELHDRYVKAKHKDVLVVLFLHLLKYKHRAFRLGKFKYFIAQIASKKGSLDLLGKKDFKLELIIDLLKLR